MEKMILFFTQKGGGGNFERFLGNFFFQIQRAEPGRREKRARLQNGY